MGVFLFVLPLFSYVCLCLHFFTYVVRAASENQAKRYLDSCIV